ncbi:hypothetical protein ACT9SR_06120 [Enterococcus faecalis]|uniref:hypothetical protein n=1 Tax=Enterococcus faecalis TaxID=1351 RepID=UPI001A0D581D|nr:hypothetical protein [Enterococcus faecalis]
MNSSYLSYVFELTLYYLLLIMSLPLVYAVTYHLSFSSMYTSEWLMISVFLSPLVLLFAGIRYGFARLKQQERQAMK